MWPIKVLPRYSHVPCDTPQGVLMSTRGCSLGKARLDRQRARLGVRRLRQRHGHGEPTLGVLRVRYVSTQRPFRARSWMPALRCPMRLREYSHANPLPFPHHAELLPHATVSTVRSVVNRTLKHMLLRYIVPLRTVAQSGAHLQCSLGRGFEVAERVRAVGARDGLSQAAKQNRSCRPFQSVSAVDDSA